MLLSKSWPKGVTRRIRHANAREHGFSAAGTKAINAAQKLEEKYGSLRMQRMIVQAKTLDDLYALR
jgi:hypothetical protein